MKFPITDIVSIYKQSRTGNKEGYGSTPIYQNVNVTISPMGDDIQPSEGGVSAFQLMEIFIWDITIQLANGDKLLSGSGVEYLITGTPNTYTNMYIQGIRTIGKVVV